MKDNSLLLGGAALTVAALATGFALGASVLGLFAVAIATAVLLIAATDYTRAARRWQAGRAVPASLRSHLRLAA